jgi:hypothetical protein
MLSYRISMKEKREMEKGSVGPIVSIDIGQVGNKNDSGTVCMVHICVDFSCIYI